MTSCCQHVFPCLFLHQIELTEKPSEERREREFKSFVNSSAGPWKSFFHSTAKISCCTLAVSVYPCSKVTTDNSLQRNVAFCTVQIQLYCRSHAISVNEVQTSPCPKTDFLCITGSTLFTLRDGHNACKNKLMKIKD